MRTLPGLKRKLMGAVDGPASLNGVSDSSMTQRSNKRLCLEDVTLAMDTSYPQNSFPTGPAVGNLASGLEGNPMNNGLGSPYSMPPKASPGSTPGGGGSSGSLASAFNLNGKSAAPSVEQELQEILEELTKNPDPSLPELDIEKILGSKADEQTSTTGSFVHPEGSRTPKRSPQRPSHLEAHLTQSPGFPQANSPQMGPSQPGTPYTLPHPSKAVPSPLSASPLPSRSGSSWREVSRAQQLQQLASNSKHHSTSSGGPQPTQPGHPSLSQQGSSWAGPSPPYRPGDKLPSSSPHQQPFSPASGIQSPQSSLMPNITPAPSAGPSPPYRPEKLGSPALPQPPFSPQNSLLPGSTPSGGSNPAVQGSQPNYLGGIPPASGTNRPSPPYRTDKQHASPAGPTPPGPQPSSQARTFNSQNSQLPNMSSQLYKAITASQASGGSSLKLLMQTSQAKSAQLPLSKATPGAAGPETLSFNNTKPLRHFDPEPHASLGGFRNGSMQAAPPTSAAGHAHLLQQSLQRGMQADSMVPHCRGDQGVGMVPHLQDPSTGQATNYNMLKTQLMRKQLQQQEKQRQMEQMNGAQIAECQQVAPFQGRAMPPDCGGYSMSTTQQPNPSMVSPLPSNRIVFPPGSLAQVGHTGPYMGGTDSKQPFYHPAQDLGMPMRPGQSMMGVGGPTRQPANQGHAVARPGMPGPSLVGSLLPTNHLRQALHQGRTPRMMCASQQQPQSQSPLWPNQQGLHPHLDPVTHQHPFPSGGVPQGCGGPQFPQRPGMAGMPANFPGTRPPPNQIAPSLVGRQMQKMACGQPLPSMSQQSLRMRGPLSAIPVMKPGAPTMMHPAHGMAPPSYPVASVGKHTPAQGYGPGHNPGHKLTPCDYPPQHQSNGGMTMGVPGPVAGGPSGSGAGGDVDFIETLVGPNEDWFNNLNMIDEYLEQNS
ncbi:mastermind-like domain-containing protein 1 isoform X2 [Electrophorus electricus]|uniref:mastermind-like domain-containing protein 1 isoform X2 n=1 Tax=Electrophorus electricus TaxID=8005 RepID=UPI0015D06012|nr:mastermind-like domain-containing protein 1 isoform X2 [Electrophorus electricus]